MSIPISNPRKHYEEKMERLNTKKELKDLGSSIGNCKRLGYCDYMELRSLISLKIEKIKKGEI